MILAESDSVIMARTGSGKTAAFCIPLIEKLVSTPSTGQVRGLILSPTRELSLQTLKVLRKLMADTNLHAVGIHGGEGMEKQFDLLSSKPDIIVATPGRLAHHLTEIPDFQLKSCGMCILDEADRLLEMGFAMQIRQISRTLPESSQKVMLSATMPKVLVEFTKSGFCQDPTVVRLDSEATVSDELRMAFITCRSDDKDAALLHILQLIREDQKQYQQLRTGLTIIFAATRHHVEYIATLLDTSSIPATMIYGTLDQEARKANLAAFRNGSKPVLVVTDVAARGIDVPLIDHVVHYHFPPAAKLFVHRSGRAARAGRIGFCWGLVDPEDLPYMIDLMVFLGRKPETGLRRDEDGKETELSYTLKEMMPDMVHYGSLPEIVLAQEVENVNRIMDAEMSGSQEAESLRALARVCQNAMKQYRKTRSEASRDAVRRAKAILEGDKNKTGQRINGTKISPHPLLRGIVMRQLEAKKMSGSRGGLEDLENMKKREDFLRDISSFRPKETIFEAFSTGRARDAGIGSQVDRGRNSKVKEVNSVSLNAMNDMRRQMRMVRDKGTTLVVAGSDILREDMEATTKEREPCSNEVSTPKAVTVASSMSTKKRMSKAERRRLKKTGGSVPSSSEDTQKKSPKAAKSFKDLNFYIENELASNPEDAYRARQIEAAMQPSAANTKGSYATALRIEEAMLDVVGDEREDLVKNHRMKRWDKAKRKYVQTTIGSELSGDSKSKKVRLESGQMVKSEKMKLGELYVKWQKKTNRTVGRTGVFDDVDSPAMPSTPYGKHGGAGEKNGRQGIDRKSAAAIKKERQRKIKNKVKNMKKSDRQQKRR